MNQRSQLPIDCHANQVAQHSVPSVLEAQVAPASPNSPTCASAWKAAAWHLPGKHGAVGGLRSNWTSKKCSKKLWEDMRGILEIMKAIHCWRKNKKIYIMSIFNKTTEAYWGLLRPCLGNIQVNTDSIKDLEARLAARGFLKRRFWGSVSEYLVISGWWKFVTELHRRKNLRLGKACRFGLRLLWQGI